MRLNAMVLLALVLVLVAPNARASQCIDACSNRPGPAKWDCYLWSHGWAFVGQVASARYICDSIPQVAVQDTGAGIEVSAPRPTLHRCSYIYRFRVKRIWRGDKKVREVEVRSRDWGIGTGYHFHEGERYIVFASSKDGVLWTGACSGNVQLGRSLAVVSEVDSVFHEMQRASSTGKGPKL